MGWTDGDGHVGERQPTFEDVHPAVPLEHVPVVQLRRQAQLGQCRRRKVPLESGVVHRQHRGEPAVERLSGEQRAQIDRRQGRVPVVRVQHPRRRRNLGQRRQRGQAEEREPVGVVRIVPVLVAVDAGPVEKVGVLDEEDLRPGAALTGEGTIQPGGLGVPADGHCQRRPAAFQGWDRLPYLAIQRQQHRRGHAGGRLKPGQTAHSLPEPAGAGERPVFGRQMDHPERRFGAGVRPRRTGGPPTHLRAARWPGASCVLRSNGRIPLPRLKYPSLRRSEGRLPDPDP